MKSPASPWAQQWAIIRRNFIMMRQQPILSLNRALISSAILLGLMTLNIMIPGPNIYWYAHSSTKYLHYLTLLNVVPNVSATASLFVSDKATGLKSLMFSMGLSRVNYYCGMSLHLMALILPVTLYTAIIIKVYILNVAVSYLTILSLFILFTVQLDAMMAASVSFVTTTNNALLIIGTVAVGSILVENITNMLIRSLDPAYLPLILFFGSASPGEVLKYFFKDYRNTYLLAPLSREELFKLQRAKVTSIFITRPVEPDAQPTYLLFIAQIFWIVLYRLFAYWFEEVCPWQKFASPRNFCYCLKLEGFNNDDIEQDSLELVSSVDGNFFEQPSKSTDKIEIQARRIRKTFGKQVAVDNVSFSIYKGETTLLLGHNGAGKTTLMNIILGLLKPDNGQVGFRDSSGAATASVIGVCPQASILSGDLTVRQHLELFSDIKSDLSGKRRACHILEIIEDVGLTEHESKTPPQLSYGLRRKLSLALALVGKSGLLILDEPSSGLDPNSRRSVWKAIRRHRSDRTVLLSTQHMDEADYLGDRIAIMSAGRIVCCGSSVFLNRIFGTGYKLRLECALSKREQIFDHIREYYFDAVQPIELGNNQQTSSNAADPIVDYALELKATDNRNRDTELALIWLLEDLENKAQSLVSVRSFKLRGSSMEDVILNATKYFASVDSVELPVLLHNYPSAASNTNSGNKSTNVSQLNMLRALIIKHLQVNIANPWTALILRVLLPAYFMDSSLDHLSHTLFEKNEIPIVAHLIYFPPREFDSKFKFIQLNSHATIWIFWLSQALADLIWLTVPMIVFNYRMWKGPYQPKIEPWQLHFLISLGLFCFYLASMLWCYCLSFIVKPKSAISIIYLISASVTVLVGASELVPPTVLPSTKNWDRIITWISCFLSPLDAFLMFLYGLERKCYVSREARRNCLDRAPGYPLIQWSLSIFCFQIALYSSLLVLIESQSIRMKWYRWLRSILPCFKKARVVSNTTRNRTDRDLIGETANASIAIDNYDKSSHSLAATKLSKSYIKTNKVIEDLSFTVRRGECLGLLGVNGSGKSTVLSMLAGVTAPDSGRILANDHYNANSLHKYWKEIGYDPQITPELFGLTPHQALSLMARLRGVNSSAVSSVVGGLLNSLEMSQHAHKYDGELSGGTKRKLALGMALIGNPAILALDMPTNGIDPMARRGIWQLLSSFRAQTNCSMIISSHAMEECETVCDRVAIMAQGKLRCIGTHSHLCSKFAMGYTLRVQLTTDKLVHELKRQLDEEIGSKNLVVIDWNFNRFTINIANNNNQVQRSNLLRMMRKFREKDPNLNYLINDSSLHDVFIALANEQKISTGG